MPDIDLDFPRDIREVLIPRVTSATAPTARPWSPPSPPTARAAPCATSARRWACRRGRSSGWRRRRLPRAEPGEIERDVVARDRRRARRARRAGGRCSALCGEAMGLPRHASQHPGGMVISTRAADRRLPGRAGGDGGAPDRPVGQGLLRRRRLPQDRPAGPGDALRGRALRRGSRARRGASGSTSRGSRSTTTRDLRIDPRRRDHRRLPDREPGADADAAAHPARATSTTSPCRWRWSGPARSRAAPSTPI